MHLRQKMPKTSGHFKQKTAPGSPPAEHPSKRCWLKHLFFKISPCVTSYFFKFIRTHVVSCSFIFWWCSWKQELHNYNSYKKEPFTFEEKTYYLFFNGPLAEFLLIKDEMSQTWSDSVNKQPGDSQKFGQKVARFSLEKNTSGKCDGKIRTIPRPHFEGNCLKKTYAFTPPGLGDFGSSCGEEICRKTHRWQYFSGRLEDPHWWTFFWFTKNSW